MKLSDLRKHVLMQMVPVVLYLSWWIIRLLDAIAEIEAEKRQYR